MTIGNGATSVPPTMMLTSEGGLGIYYINKTGAASVRGSLVNTEASVDGGVALVNGTIPDYDIIGVVYESGIADGSAVLVIVSGVADLLLEDGTAATRGYWVAPSLSVVGRADMTNAAPPGGTITNIQRHFQECGHCMQTISSGTDVLARATVHFN